MSNWSTHALNGPARLVKLGPQCFAIVGTDPEVELVFNTRRPKAIKKFPDLQRDKMADQHKICKKSTPKMTGRDMAAKYLTNCTYLCEEARSGRAGKPQPMPVRKVVQTLSLIHISEPTRPY